MDDNFFVIIADASRSPGNIHVRPLQSDKVNSLLLNHTMELMKRSDVNPMPQFFDRYINKAEDIPIVEALEKYATIEDALDQKGIEELGDKVYAPGKWTIKDILQHIIDNERIQGYRALRIARNDQTVLPGYDENLLAQHADANKRLLSDLLAEFSVVRRSNIFLFKNLSDEALQRVGTCYQVKISPLALGFVLVGHQLHHIDIIKERYLPLLS